jgi:hypothetical protein
MLRSLGSERDPGVISWSYMEIYEFPNMLKAES